MSVWTTPTTRSLGFLVTPAVWNADIVENLKYLKTSPVFDGSPVVDGPAIGIGVTPSGWGTINDLGAVQITGGALWATGSSEISVGQNYYYNGMLTLYRTSAAASEYKQSAGVHTWSTASSGTAGNSFSFTEGMRLDASGNLGIGTSSPSARLHVDGVAGSTTAFFNQANAGKTGIILAENGVARGYLSQVGLYAGNSDGNFGIFVETGYNFQIATNGSATSKFTVTTGGNIAIGAAARIYLDGVAGTGNTYQEESAADVYQLVVGGTTKLRAAQTGISVSTSATTILADAGGLGSFVVVNGNDGSNRFCDLVLASTATAPTVVSSYTSLGSPAARTYTRSSDALQLAMASGTYSVHTVKFGS